MIDGQMLRPIISALVLHIPADHLNRLDIVSTVFILLKIVHLFLPYAYIKKYIAENYSR